MTSSRSTTSPVGTAIPGMRIYFAGASGVLGSRLEPLLLGAGHTVGAMTRSAEKANRLASVGAQPVVCDVLEEAVLAADGVVLRYGFFYGPATYFEGELPTAPRVHIDIAATRTLEALDAPSGRSSKTDR